MVLDVGVRRLHATSGRPLLNSGPVDRHSRTTQSRSLSGAHALGRAGSHDLSVGELDDELPIGSEREDPATFVDAVVVVAAKWKEVGEVGRSTVSPPVHVMRFGVSERHVATRYGARGMAEGFPLVARIGHVGDVRFVGPV